jgi:hypothetical protein
VCRMHGVRHWVGWWRGASYLVFVGAMKSMSAQLPAATAGCWSDVIQLGDSWSLCVTNLCIDWSCVEVLVLCFCMLCVLAVQMQAASAAVGLLQLQHSHLPCQSAAV